MATDTIDEYTNEEYVNELRAVAGADCAGVRLDRFIALQFEGEGVSRNYAEQLIARGSVLVNGQPASKKNDRLAAGDEVTVLVPAPVPLDVTLEDIPLDIFPNFLSS